MVRNCIFAAANK